MVRRGERRRGAVAAEPSSASTFVAMRRKFAPSTVLTEDEVREVHHLSLRVLSEIGLTFHAESAWDTLEGHGCAVDRSTGNVRFDPAVVEHFVGMSPPDFDIAARDPAKTVHFGGDSIVWGSASSAPNVVDAERGRRPGTGAVLQELIKLGHMLPTCHLFGGHSVEPIDRPPNTRHLDSVFDWITLSDKALRVYGIGETRVDDGLEMIKLGYGIDEDQLRATPHTMSILNVNSPLLVDEPLLLGSLALARRGQATVVSPVAMSGAMSPITASGSLIQHNAESIGVSAYLQMEVPGCHLFYGSLVAAVDMRSGAPAMGVPEAVTGAIAAGQMARFYAMPYRTWLGSTSNTVDAQAAYESMMSIMAAHMGGAHFVHHGHGWMQGGLTTGFEKTMLDADLIEMYDAIKPRIDADEVIEAIREVGAGGHFLGSSHTMSRYQSEFHTPKLSDWRNYEAWAEAGATRVIDRATVAWKELLETYEAPALDVGRRAALVDFVERRKREIGPEDIG
ncbi:MAG: trimethylamine methyltransferase family protein [Acidimicrobiales bacterium]